MYSQTQEERGQGEQRLEDGGKDHTAGSAVASGRWKRPGNLPQSLQEEHTGILGLAELCDHTSVWV